MSLNKLKQLILFIIVVVILALSSGCIKKQRFDNHEHPAIKNENNESEGNLEKKNNEEKKSIKEKQNNVATTTVDEIIEPERKNCPGELDIRCWKTYRNYEYGFEVKYPYKWAYHKAKIGIESDPHSLLSIFFPKEDLCILIEVYDISKLPLWGMATGTKKEKIQISNLSGTKYILRRKSQGTIGGKDVEISVELPKNSKLFKIIYLRDLTETVYEPIFGQMLKEFKFLN